MDSRQNFKSSKLRKSKKQNRRLEVQIQKKQRKVCAYLLKKLKGNYYENIGKTYLTYFKKFWKTINSIFDSKLKSSTSISLGEITKIIQEKEELAKISNECFFNIVKNLEINENLLPTSSSKTRNVEFLIAKFENHPRIMR